jgi:beta-alanine--pyruvate transaminase
VAPDITKSNSLESYWLPFTANRAFKARPRLISKAAGMYYETPNGQKILDATSGLYCVNAGHGRPEIAAAIKAAADQLDFAPPFQHAHPEVFRFSARITDLAPGDLDYVLLATSGSEAVETALKLALAYHRAKGEAGRTRLIGRERGYHGVGLGGTAVGGMVNNRRQFGALVTGIDHLSTTYNRDKQAFSIGEPAWGRDLADDLTRLVALHGGETIAAVIVEPVAGSTGCLPPPKGYLERLRAITEAHGILLIFDEVITGFGRLGYAFAAERYGIVPDMITFAKGATNGAAPLSGVVARKGIYDAFMDGPENQIELFHGFTYSGHPLSVAAGSAALDVYRDEGLFQRAQAIEPMFAEIMMGLKGAPHVADIRTIGLMCGIDLTARPNAPGARGFDVIERGFHDFGIYVRVVGDTLVIAPPLIASLDDLALIVERVSKVLQTLA